MDNIQEWKGRKPVLGRDCHVDPGALVVGDVALGDGCSVWHGACLRGDINRIRLGRRVNVQEGASLHVSYGDGWLEIGDDVTIGHNATVHACRIQGRALVGMGAILLDGCRIGRGAVVAAGALVKQGCEVGDGELWAGVPARRVRALEPDEQERLIDQGVAEYEQLGRERAAALARPPHPKNPFRAALAGVAEAFRTQRNMRIHAVAAVAAAGLGVWLGLARWEWVVLVFCLSLVPALECVNTALEATVDLASPSRHPLAKRAKDCAAAAVLLASSGTAAVGALLFLPKLLARF